LIFRKKGWVYHFRSISRYSTYDRFKAYVAANSLNESSTMVIMLERGMANF
jgi:hypothetical protein